MHFQTLVNHFFERFFDKDSISPDSEARTTLIQIIAVLALPGAVISLFLMADHPLVRYEIARMWARTGDRYAFVAYSMTVMGFVMTLKWDSLFPHRRDYLILTSLPISLREFFAAKVAALCAFLLIFVMAINFFSSFLTPVIYVIRHNSLDVIVPSFTAHTIAVTGGSIFMALLFAAFQGVLINLMSPAAFRRISPHIQMLSMMILVTLLLITPGIAGNLRFLVETDSPVFDFIPLFWFLGLYEVLNPEGTTIARAYVWASTALTATGIVAAVFVLSYLGGYRRQSRKILEDIESNVFVQPWWTRRAASLLNALFLRHSFQRASFYFIGRIFGRSAKHRLFMAMYSGLGLALTLSSLIVIRPGDAYPFGISASGLLEAPLVLSFFVVSGLRATFNIPYELGANWMFRITGGSDASEYQKATRRWVFLRGILPLYALIAPFEFVLFETADAVFHLGFGLVASAFLTEVFFFNFNKVPFTCSYFPGKSHMAFLAVTYLYGFTMYTRTAARLQEWASASPARAVFFLAAAAALFAGLALYRRRSHTCRIMYQDEADPVVRQLNLS